MQWFANQSLEIPKRCNDLGEKTKSQTNVPTRNSCGSGLIYHLNCRNYFVVGKAECSFCTETRLVCFLVKTNKYQDKIVHNLATLKM